MAAGMERTSFALFYGAVAVSAWFGGLGPALVATVLATFAHDYFFVPPLYTLPLGAPSLPRLLVVCGVGLLISYLATSRERAERSLLQRDGTLAGSEAGRAAILEAALDCIITIDHQDKVIEWNPAAEATFGYSRREALGQPLGELIVPPSLREAHYRGMAAFMQTRQGRVLGRRLEFPAMRKDGSEFPAELAITCIGCDDPLPLFTGYLRDITERKRYEQALRDSEQRFRTLFESMDEGFCVIEVIFDERNNPTDYRFLEINPAFERQTGIEQAKGRLMREIAPDHEQHWFDTYGRIALTGETLRFENEAAALGRWYDVCAFRVGPAELRRVGIVFNDITERRRAEDERERLLQSERSARTEAEEANRIKDEFLATLGHELRTPLNAILGWSQLLKAGTSSGENFAEGLAAIERNARAQTRIIEDLLDMSRIISGKVQMEVRPVELPRVIDAAIESVRPAAEAKGIHLHRVLDSGAGPVMGDPGRLQQVTWNLLSNAIKFTPKGGHVQVVLDRVDSQVEVRVSDTGQGIRPDFLPQVFDRFRQANGSTTRRHAGLGLGLSIVKHLVELHGGTVTASSRGEGQGATFTVRLPLSIVRAPEEEVPSVGRPTAVVDGAVDCERADISGVRVLVVDDEPDALALMKRLLEECDALVATASCVSEALEALRREKPHVLVSDIGMPEHDGYDLIKQVRALPPEGGGKTPAVALTAYARSEDRRRALLAGYEMHLAKPVEPAELVTVIGSLSGRTGPGHRV
jgi:PAS domain S-box-containing protein